MNRLSGFLLFAGCLLLHSCAIQVAPSGGEKDVAPPAVVNASPENYSTEFHSTAIRIVFDEFIELKDLNSQLVVSPPLKYTPETRVKKKTLSVHLDDTLQENATYTMNFGNAIVDIHEGNAIENFQYVFSTGAVIDSLKISGSVEDAFNKKTEKGILVMLYRNDDDSLPLKNLPNYFAKTDESGKFEIRNVSPGLYRIFALKDNNSNFLFDNQEETIAFSEKQADAGAKDVSLRSFRETPRQRLLKVTADEPGNVTITYSRPLENPVLRFQRDTTGLQLYYTQYSSQKDTLILWYRNQSADSLQFILSHQAGQDTISIRLKKPDPKNKTRSAATLFTQYNSKNEIPLTIGRPVVIVFNHPIEKFLPDSFLMKEDSVELKNLHIYFKDSLKRNLVVDYPVREQKNYTIQYPPGTFIDIFGTGNDTTKLTLATKAVSDFGTLSISIKGDTSSSQSIIQLIDDKETIWRESIVHGDTTLNYELLEPRSYRIKRIEDPNRNGKWDTGNYLLKKQPERIDYYQENITVRSNWDVEVKWGPETPSK